VDSVPSAPDPAAPAGRRISPALAVLLIVLGLTAAGFSYVIARRLVADRPPGSAAGSVTSDPATPGGVTPGGVTSPPVSVPKRARCPRPTALALEQAGLNGDLTLELYVRVRRADGRNNEAWVCRNADGVLVYQGHTPGPLDSADNGRNTIMLAASIKGEVAAAEGGFVARNPGDSNTTEYQVTRESLVVRRVPDDGNAETFEVVEFHPAA
jgi:hypothetical protein